MARPAPGRAQCSPRSTPRPMLRAQPYSQMRQQVIDLRPFADRSIRSKIGGSQTVHPKDQRDFAAMMQIVFHHMVDHPTARYLVHLTVPFIRESPGAVAGCPALQAGVDECPRLIEAAYQF